MDYEEMAQLRYQEMCRIVGDVVFAMVAEGHETKRVAIADVIRTEIARAWISGIQTMFRLWNWRLNCWKSRLIYST